MGGLALLAHPQSDGLLPDKYGSMCEQCYTLADAMLAARKAVAK